MVRVGQGLGMMGGSSGSNEWMGVGLAGLGEWSELGLAGLGFGIRFACEGDGVGGGRGAGLWCMVSVRRLLNFGGLGIGSGDRAVACGLANTGM